MSKRLMQNWSLISLFVTLFNIHLIAGSEVSGFVRDWGRTPPRNGLSGVRVKLVPERGNPIVGGNTDAEGNYVVNDVPHGGYTIVFDKVGYIPRPHDSVRVIVKAGKNIPPDVLLARGHADSEYYKVVATQFIAKASNAEVKPKVYSEQWQQLRDMGFSPTSKFVLVSFINKQDKEAKKALPALNDYLQLDLETVKQAEVKFSLALQGKEAMPTQASLAGSKVGQEVVRDIVLFQLNSTASSAPQRRVFLREFLSAWNGTPAGNQIQDWSTNDFDRKLYTSPP